MQKGFSSCLYAKMPQGSGKGQQNLTERLTEPLTSCLTRHLTVALTKSRVAGVERVANGCQDARVSP